MALSMLAFTSLAVAHVPEGFPKLPVNPLLGVPGFPDCFRDERAVANGASFRLYRLHEHVARSS